MDILLCFDKSPGLILGLSQANEGRRYFVTSLMGWAQTWKQPLSLRSVDFIHVLHDESTGCGQPYYAPGPVK